MKVELLKTSVDSEKVYWSFNMSTHDLIKVVERLFYIYWMFSCQDSVGKKGVRP